MFFENRSRDQQPLMRIGNFPIGVTTLLVGWLVCGVIVSALLGPFQSSEFLAFSPEAVWRRGQIWRIVSYLAVGQVGFFTIFNLLFVYSFGRDCEQELSRARYLVLLAILIATPVFLHADHFEAALKAGRPGFAAVDVYESEPILGATHPLLAMDNVVATPHLGYVERSNYETFFGTAFDNVVNFIKGTPTNIVNPGALQVRR